MDVCSHNTVAPNPTADRVKIIPNDSIVMGAGRRTLKKNVSRRRRSLKRIQAGGAEAIELSRASEFVIIHGSRIGDYEVTAFAGKGGDPTIVSNIGTLSSPTLKTVAFQDLRGIALDTAGSLYVTCHSCVIKITPPQATTYTMRGSVPTPNLPPIHTPSSTIQLYAGNPTIGDTAGNKSGSDIRFYNLSGVVYDPRLNCIYVTDCQVHQVCQLYKNSGGTTTCFVLINESSKSILNSPRGITLDKDGAIFVACYDSSSVTRLPPPALGAVGTGSNAIVASIEGADGIAICNDVIYVSSSTQHCIYSLTRNGVDSKGVPKYDKALFAGAVNSSDMSDVGIGGPLTNARFKHPQSLCADSANKLLYVYDGGNRCIRVINIEQKAVGRIYGGNNSSIDGRASAGASFRGSFRSDQSQPETGQTSYSGLAVDPNGYIYVSDFGDNFIRQASPVPLTPPVFVTKAEYDAYWERQRASSAMASNAVIQTASSALAQVASSAVAQRASSMNQSSAVQQTASSALAQIASSAVAQQASGMRQSSAVAQQASSAIAEEASSALAQHVSGMRQSSAVAQEASSAVAQVASSALAQQISGSRESSAVAQAASSALAQEISGAQQSSAVAQEASKAEASSALAQYISGSRESSAVAQVASSALAQEISGAQQSSAVAQEASKAEASSAVAQADSSAQEQKVSSAKQQFASSAMQQADSSAQKQSASSAVAQKDSSAQEQAASASFQQRASSAEQQTASSAQQQVALGQAVDIKDGIKATLVEVQNDLAANLQELYSSEPSTASGSVLSTLESKLQTLYETKRSLITSATAVFQLSPGYQDPSLQTVIQEAAPLPQGLKKVYDTLRNKYVYLDANSRIVANPVYTM